VNNERRDDSGSEPATHGVRRSAVIALGAIMLCVGTRAADDSPDLGGPPEALRPFCTPYGYPAEAALRGAQGVTRVRYAIGADGRAEAIEIVSPSGASAWHAQLDRAAVEFLKGCRFDAATSQAPAARQMDYDWHINRVFHDAWTRIRHDLPGEAPETYPILLTRDCQLPTWPADTREKVKAGDLLLVLRVDDEGAVRATEVLRSSGQGVIDDEVRHAVGKCRFKPAERDGQRVAAATELLYPWADGRPRVLPATWRQPDRIVQTASAFTRGCLDPQYPSEAAHQGQTGMVKIRLRYEATGVLAGSTILTSSGFPLLDEATQVAYMKCKYEEVFGAGPVEDKEVEVTWHLE
jgi:TonB family protein